jgi:DNA-binding MarR family transcriptional regulator
MRIAPHNIIIIITVTEKAKKLLDCIRLLNRWGCQIMKTLKTLEELDEC